MTVQVDPSVVLDSLTQGVYVVDPERRITYWNGSAAQLSGYSPEQVVGTRCQDALLNHVDHQGRELCGDRCPLRATMRDGLGRSVHVFMHHRDGHLTPVHVSAAVLRNADGEIIGAVETFTDDSDYAATTDRAHRLERLSLLDPLTGVPNRRFLDAHLDERLDALGTRCTTFGVLMIDVDHFKLVNDTHGHETGDQALRAIARTLAGAVRSDDVVARYGGEEFVVVSDRAQPAQLLALAERLRGLVRATRIAATGLALRTTISAGVTVARPGDTAATLLARADGALLRAKREGRDRALLA